ncbi:hypothetical protein BN1723_010569 [Verticillium longisporum]|uniref:Uncharacterized protein n=1 Tax=Verticillium longisporum TaxID=100787 RepID=A0A0G4KZG7_VERLO|nr:hypothetical protein BN1708_000190 [Verticillium longisporum]CRK15193.1 hypothetical protein BN1723_010569 [Verticillium longisporum]
MSRAWVWAEIAYGVLVQPTNATGMLIKGCQLDPTLAFPVPALVLTREKGRGSEKKIWMSLMSSDVDFMIANSVVSDRRLDQRNITPPSWNAAIEAILMSRLLRRHTPGGHAKINYDTTSEGFKLLLLAYKLHRCVTRRSHRLIPSDRRNSSSQVFASEHTYSHVGPEKEKPVTAGKTSPENSSTNSTMTDIVATHFTLGLTTWLSKHDTVSAALAPVNDERHASNTGNAR